VTVKKTTPKAMALLRKYGYTGCVVERTHGGFNHDWCGFADIIACRVVPGREWTAAGVENDIADLICYDGTLAVQCTVKSSHSAHIDKVLFDYTKKGKQRTKDLQEYLESGNRFEIWSFPDAAWIRKNPVAKQEDHIRVSRIVFVDGEFYNWDNSEVEAFGFTVSGF